MGLILLASAPTLIMGDILHDPEVMEAGGQQFSISLSVLRR